MSHMRYLMPALGLLAAPASMRDPFTEFDDTRNYKTTKEQPSEEEQRTNSEFYRLRRRLRNLKACRDRGEKLSPEGELLLAQHGTYAISWEDHG